MPKDIIRLVGNSLGYWHLWFVNAHTHALVTWIIEFRYSYIESYPKHIYMNLYHIASHQYIQTNDCRSIVVSVDEETVNENTIKSQRRGFNALVYTLVLVFTGRPFYYGRIVVYYAISHSLCSFLLLLFFFIFVLFFSFYFIRLSSRWAAKIRLSVPKWFFFLSWLLYQTMPNRQLCDFYTNFTIYTTKSFYFYAMSVCINVHNCAVIAVECLMSRELKWHKE